MPSSVSAEKAVTLERVVSLQDTYPQHLGLEDMEEGDRDSVVIYPEVTEL